MPTALITGGARGIGLGIARALGAGGCDLALSGLRGEGEVADVLAELRSLGVRVLYCQSDVGDAGDRARLLDRVRSEFGRLNYLVNNAGISSVGRKDILEADEASFDRVLATNLKGPYFLTQAAARQMIAERQADANFAAGIVNISSVSAEIVSVNRGDYCLSKAAAGMATKLWAARLSEFGIPVYEVQPGIIASDMTAGGKGKYDRMIAAGELGVAQRWGQPEDVGRAVATLLAGGIPYATGQVLKIDGGMTIRVL